MEFVTSKHGKPHLCLGGYRYCEKNTLKNRNTNWRWIIESCKAVRQVTSTREISSLTGSQSFVELHIHCYFLDRLLIAHFPLDFLTAVVRATATTVSHYNFSPFFRSFAFSNFFIIFSFLKMTFFQGSKVLRMRFWLCTFVIPTIIEKSISNKSLVGARVKL